MCDLHHSAGRVRSHPRAEVIARQELKAQKLFQQAKRAHAPHDATTIASPFITFIACVHIIYMYVYVYDICIYTSTYNEGTRKPKGLEPLARLKSAALLLKQQCVQEACKGKPIVTMYLRKFPACRGYCPQRLQISFWGVKQLMSPLSSKNKGQLGPLATTFKGPLHTFPVDKTELEKLKVWPQAHLLHPEPQPMGLPGQQ